MKWQKSFLVNQTVIALITLLLSATCAAQEFTSKLEQFFHSNQAGIRIGVWNNNGETPNQEITIDDATYKTDIKNASFYFEAHVGWRLTRYAITELSFGIVNKGEITRRDLVFDVVDYGSFLIYPIHARMKIYPLSSTSIQFQPYLMAGGGFYYARTNNQISTDYYSEFREKSATDFNYVVGGGIDWPIAYKFGLEAQVSYMPINFSKSMLGAHDYKALTFTIGVKHYFRSSGKK